MRSVCLVVASAGLCVTGWQEITIAGQRSRMLMQNSVELLLQQCILCHLLHQIEHGFGPNAVVHVLHSSTATLRYEWIVH